MTATRELRPWHDCPSGPCGCGPVGCLSPNRQRIYLITVSRFRIDPYSPGRWYGPQDATLFCPACGTGWHGTDEQIEQALIAETWWDAYMSQSDTKAAFAEASR